MSETIGIEKIKEAAIAVIKFGKKLEDALEDGKLSFFEGLSLAIGSAPEAFALAQSAPQLKAEFQDLSDDERVQLVDYVVEELDLNADGVEAVAEAGFELLLSLDNLRRAIKDAKSE